MLDLLSAPYPGWKILVLRKHDMNPCGARRAGQPILRWMGTDLPGDLSPAVRQQFFKPFYRVFRNASEHLSEPGKRIDSGQFTRSNEAAKDCRGLAAFVASEERPVVTTHCKTPQRPLGAVVIDQQIAVGTVAG